MSNTVPRRFRIDMMVPAEKAIYDAQQEVEKMGAHQLLTDATVLLSQARDKVATVVDLRAKDALKRLVRNLNDPIDEVDSMTDEQVRAYLIEEGYDPEDLKRSLDERLKKIKAQLSAPSTKEVTEP